LLGIWDSSVTQGRPLAPLLTVKESVVLTAGVPDQGVCTLVVVKVPQVEGVRSAALGPPKRLTLKSSTGSSGFSVKAAVSCPVWGSASVRPASLATMPSWGLSITT
jgi:hypothetical protein